MSPGTEQHPAAGMRALVFDFGGPVLLTPFETLRSAERRLALDPGTLDWQGPFDPPADPMWQAMTAGAMTERDYWQRRAEELHAVAGTGPDPRQLFTMLYDDDPAQLVRSPMRLLLRRAKAAGLMTAVLTNDLARFHPRSWVAGIDFLNEVDTVVDGSVTGVLKPDPAAFALLLDALGLAASEVLFTDDQVHNVQAAAAVGMQAVWFDVTAPEHSVAAVAAGSGLDLS
jgi:putative hydrolase of the HAD superfamily